jgi:tRNA threonylcarbamoyl adenosine modification protein (Sua5/YciO/YrdC/YwlC family)
MAQYLELHPTHPQERLLKTACDLLQNGQVLAMPTDSCYALVCQLDDQEAVQKMRRIKGVDESHLLTLMCRDLSQLATYAKVDNRQFRLLKSATPGPYTFILEATKEVPKRVSQPKRKTIGLRVPDHAALQMLLSLHGRAIVSTTLSVPESNDILSDPQDIRARLERQLGAIVDSGAVPSLPTTVLDLTPMDKGLAPTLIRQGRGSLELLGISSYEI